MTISIRKISNILREAGFAKSSKGGRSWCEGYEIKNDDGKDIVSVRYTFGNSAMIMPGDNRIQNKIDAIRKVFIKAGIAVTMNEQKTIIFIDRNSSIDTPANS